MTPELLGTLPSIESFCATFEQGSFTSAARVLGKTPQAASRSVARLERALGVVLFRRTTRALAATDEGRAYYDLCTRALALLATGQQELRGRRRAIAGDVRVSVPSTYGLALLGPALEQLRARLPGVRLELSVTNRNVDFVTEGVDFAVRLGTIRERGLVARKLGDYPLGVFASRAYLAAQGAPRELADLSRHACIGFVMPSSGRVLPWTFLPGPTTFRPSPAYTASEDPLGAIALARAGLGLVQTYDFLVADDVARGTLAEVLIPFKGASRPFSIVYPRTSSLSRAARAVKDLVVEAAGVRERASRNASNKA
jgi:DNA-binding transcriptional LysR family regulator